METLRMRGMQIWTLRMDRFSGGQAREVGTRQTVSVRELVYPKEL